MTNMKEARHDFWITKYVSYNVLQCISKTYTHTYIHIYVYATRSYHILFIFSLFIIYDKTYIH